MHKKILLKLSGEFLQAGENAVDINQVEKLVEQIEKFIKKDIQVAIVIGAGNIMRGRNIDKTKYSDLVPAHYTGMLGTVINSLMLNMVLQQKGINSRVISPFDIKPAVNVYDVSSARDAFKNGEIIILGGGTGQPGVSTDTAAVNLGADLGVEAVYKGTLVDGVYSDDPNKNSAAVKFDNLNYQEAIDKKLTIMDVSAFEKAKEHKIPLIVFKWDDASIDKLLAGESVGTVISN